MKPRPVDCSAYEVERMLRERLSICPECGSDPVLRLSSRARNGAAHRMLAVGLRSGRGHVGKSQPCWIPSGARETTWRILYQFNFLTQLTRGATQQRPAVSARTSRNGLRLAPLLDPRNRTRRWGCQLFQGESESSAASVMLTLSQKLSKRSSLQVGA